MDILAPILLKLIIVIAAARFAGVIAVKLKMPAVIGELLAGVALGPSIYHLITPASEPVLSFLAEIGIILMLFEVGLESDIKDLLKEGRASLLVGSLGIVIPLLLGFVYVYSLGMGFMTALLIGIMLSATSIGITMRVFYELKKVHTKEAEIILGASVIDDIIGLMLLSIIVSLIETGAISFFGIGKIIFYSILFFGGVLSLGFHFIPKLYKITGALKIKRTFLISEFLFALILSLIANQIGLATIVGAFAAGLILEKSKYKATIERRIHPLSRLFVPIFFVMAGANLNIWSLGLGSFKFIFFIFAIAIIGKIVAGLGAKGASKFIVGLGMIPRGEVALILISFGLNQGILSNTIYSSLVIVIMLTALIVPPILTPFVK